MLEETWKKISDFLPDFVGYEVSDQGRIKSFVQDPNYPRYLSLTAKSYLTVTLCAGYLQQTHLVHLLVATAFLGPRPTPQHVCNHKDGNKQNPALDNLEWVTDSEDKQHAHRTGLANSKGWTYDHRGESNGMATLSFDKVAEIRRLFATKTYKQRELAEKYGVSPSAISRVVTGARW
jgi:hypothetical protein